MILTNRYKYPEAVVKAVQNEMYKPNYDIWRVTEIIDSPLVKKLLIKYWDDIEIDVDDYIYSSLFGTAWHKFLSAWEVDAMVERRWSVRYCNTTLSGQSDIYKQSIATVEDNKVVGAFSLVFGQPHWDEQLNIYATLIEDCGFPVRKLYINAFIRDWSRYEAAKYNRKDGYPDRKFYKKKVPLWNRDKREVFINSRLRLHLDTNESYECTPDERWQKKTTYAVMKIGQKKAKRVLDTIDEAKKWVDNQTKDKNKLSIVERPGECTRCKSYCPVRSVCTIKGYN